MGCTIINIGGMTSQWAWYVQGAHDSTLPFSGTTTTSSPRKEAVKLCTSRQLKFSRLLQLSLPVIRGKSLAMLSISLQLTFVCTLVLTLRCEVILIAFFHHTFYLCQLESVPEIRCAHSSESEYIFQSIKMNRQELHYSRLGNFFCHKLTCSMSA